VSIAAGLATNSLAHAETPAPQTKPGEPTDPKATKTYNSAIDWEKHGYASAAIDSYITANKQDGGHCTACLSRALALADRSGNFKEAVEVLRLWLPLEQTDKERAYIHYRLASFIERQGIAEKNDKRFNESRDELTAALQLDPTLTAAHFGLGKALAHLHQDDAARAEFKTFLDQDKENPDLHARVQRYVERVELARATMAPPFQINTIDGQHVTMDSLAGKVVLIDFWATWCGPCRQALPHMQSIVKRFSGQPFVAISISLDSDDGKWKTFVAKNDMTWLQARDGGFNGRIAQLFAVRAIPATFSIDADGVLEDQNVGDADIEGKLKKMVARAVEVANQKPAQEIHETHGSGE
jgi:thiol-disulfide isomerase/thioredoxin